MHPASTAKLSTTQITFAKALKAALLGSGGLLSLCAAPALAQTTGPAAAPTPVDASPATSVSEGEGVGDIVVTARRDAEDAQRVPVSIQVVTGDGLAKLAITSVEEVSKLAPGLSLVNAGNSTSVTLRGVTWQPGSGTPATPIYFNEVPFDPGTTIQSLFDVGQIEVLRGPQGTTRGAPSISGAVTITTHKPDLDEFGGSFLGLYGQGHHRDAQIALNAPIIKDVLAIRLAANIENSDGNRVYSVNGAVDPSFKDRTYRATVLFKPTDTISIEAMYQRRRSRARAYDQEVGTGSPGFAGTTSPTILPAIPAGFNGPVLTARDRASVQDLPSLSYSNVDLFTVNASWDVLGHTITANHGEQYGRELGTANQNASDYANIIPGFEAFTSPRFNVHPAFHTNEVRFSSRPSPDRPFDYDLGWFQKYSNGHQIFTSPVYLAGAFGNPATAAPGNAAFSPVPNGRYVLTATTNIHLRQEFDSFYGNVRFHIDRNTELSGGIAILRDHTTTQVSTLTDSAANAVALNFPGAFGSAICPRIGGVASPVYTGTPLVCDVLIPAGTGGTVPFDQQNKYTDAIYNASLSHSFAENLLVYATTGSSFRSGLPAINNQGLPNDLLNPNPEKAKSYELGVKTTFGRRLRINGDIYQLDYKGQLNTFEGVPYYDVGTSRIRQTSVAFYRNLDARVRGVEAEIAAKPFDHLSLGAQISYSRITSRGGQVPVPGPVSATNIINFGPSKKGQVLNQQPPFQVTVNGDYDVPITDDIGGYFRFNVTHRGRNPNFGNFGTVVVDGAGVPVLDDTGQRQIVYRSTSSYQLVDLFAGVTGEKAGWDLGVYAKNVFNVKKELTSVAIAGSVYSQFAAAGGYARVRTTVPREIGVTLRYAFGSH